MPPLGLFENIYIQNIHCKHLLKYHSVYYEKNIQYEFILYSFFMKSRSNLLLIKAFILD